MLKQIALLMGLVVFSGGVASAEDAGAGAKASPILEGIKPGLLGIAQIVAEHQRRGDHEILMANGAKLMLMPDRNGGYLVSERRGDRERNFVFRVGADGQVGLETLEILRGGSILNKGSKVLRGNDLRRYVARIQHAFATAKGVKR